MADINPDELVVLGEGTCYSGNKLYIPKTVLNFLNLNVTDKVEYYIIMDPNHKDKVVLKKV